MRFFLPVVFLGIVLSWQASAQSLNYQVLASKIEQNETSGKDEYLIFWSEKEEFPSLGIGHFIWLPKAQNHLPFKSKFFAMAKFVNATYPAPAWVLQANVPWKNRLEFLAFKQTAQYQELLSWLKNTKPQQAEFIVADFKQELATNFIAQLSLQEKAQLDLLLASNQGTFALLDYTNFKGWGTSEKETYQGRGWGLLQVLQAMQSAKTSEEAVKSFIVAAKQILQKRTELAPVGRGEERWLAGWFVRLDGYAKK